MKFLTAFDTNTGDTFSCATLYMSGRNEYTVLDLDSNGVLLREDCFTSLLY